jgi:hypothetical protein
MSNSLTGVKAHDDVVIAAEATRQSAVAAATTQAAVNTATTVFLRTVAASQIKDGLTPAASMTALHDLCGGVGQ